MIDYKNISNFYFLGIGGIGMSALARFANASGKSVAGYDLTCTPLTMQLEEEGINIHYTDDINQLPNSFQAVNTLIVRTPAVPDSHTEYQYFIKNDYRIIKRSELLGFLTNSHFCIAVAGTHGKTSVSTMITHLLYETGVDIGAFLGGISRNFNSNLLLPKSDNSIVVAEADEFDRSFLHLSPSLSVITSVDPDHLDIYGSFEKVKEAFGLFVCNIRDGGKVLFNKRVNLMHHVTCQVNAYYYSIDEEADFCIKNLKILDGNFIFDFFTPFMVIHDVRMGYPGRVNLENMVAAASIAMLAGVDPMAIKKAIISYKGVKRRFDIQFKSNEKIYIDDYAHHPRELEATISSVKELYCNKRVLGIFQPHLFSRTQDFSTQFAQSLDLLDEVILLDIYPAREIAIPGVTSEIILKQMKIAEKLICSLEEVVDILQTKQFDVLLTMGAGNIDKLVEPITEMLKKQ